MKLFIEIFSFPSLVGGTRITWRKQKSLCLELQQVDEEAGLVGDWKLELTLNLEDKEKGFQKL